MAWTAYLYETSLRLREHWPPLATVHVKCVQPVWYDEEINFQCQELDLLLCFEKPVILQIVIKPRKGAANQ